MSSAVSHKDGLALDLRVEKETERKGSKSEDLVSMNAAAVSHRDGLALDLRVRKIQKEKVPKSEDLVGRWRAMRA
jgi:hypothetical protein